MLEKLSVGFRFILEGAGLEVMRDVISSGYGLRNKEPMFLSLFVPRVVGKVLNSRTRDLEVK